MMRRGAALLALFVALSVLHTWPLSSDISGLSRLDNDDTGLNVFVVSWVAHVIPINPLDLFDAPIFFPERHTLAYSEHMLVPSLMGAPLLWAGIDPVVVYNLLVLAGFALSGWTMSLVMRAWTGSTTAGIVSGMLFAFNAHLLTRLPHLQALHVEFLPLALYALDQVLVRTRRLGQAVIGLAAAFVLQALCSNYTLVFLSAALLVAASVRMPEWAPASHRRRALALVAAGALAIAAVAPFLWPYYVVSRDQGLTRSADEVRLYSAGWLDYLTTGGRFHYAAWSAPFFDGRTPLFPGVLGFALAVSGLGHREVRRNPRVRMMVAIAIVGVALSFGPALPGYTWLHAHVPLLQGIRAAARWGFLMLTAVAMLAGFTVAAWQRHRGTSAYWPAGAMAIVGVVTLEALRAPMGFTSVVPVPAIYAQLHARAGAVLVELPLYAGASVSENARYLVAATRHFRPLVNGYSGFETEAFRQRASRWRAFPDAAVLDEMQALGVTHVIVHVRDLNPEQVAAAAAVPRLRLVTDDGERRLYELMR
jgi:hypothetical protein